ncbi:conserved hypothetical protein [Gammaproteobacteria bacterium]
MITWWNKYIGLPYLEKGRDTAGVDCWGLARLVYAEEFGITLPCLSEQYKSGSREGIAELIALEKEGWEITEAPRSGDVVLFVIHGFPSHLGLVTLPGFFLHVLQNKTVVVERLESPLWKSRLRGVYRYRGTGSTLTVAACPHPLHARRIDTQIAFGKSIGELVCLVSRDYGVPTRLAEDGVVIVDGELIPRACWAEFTPRPGARVEYRAVAKGSGGTRVISMFATMVIAWYAAPFLVGGLGGTAFTMAGSWTGATTAAFMGINMAGSLLLNAIFPVRKPDNLAAASPKTSYMLQGGANQKNPYAAIPVVLGRYRFTPPLGAETYSEMSGTDSYLRILIVWGYGPLLVSDLRIGETALAKFADVESETLNGWDDTDEDQTRFHRLYSADVTQLYVSVKLNYDDGWLERTLDDAVDQIKVCLNFPMGLFKQTLEGIHAGEIGSTSVSVSIQIQQVGVSSWDEVAQVIYSQFLNLQPAYYNIDNDAELEPVYCWYRVSLDKHNQIIIRQGAYTANAAADPSGPLLTRLRNDNHGVNATFEHIPELGEEEEDLWKICVLGGSIHQTIDSRGANNLGSVTGCALSFSGLRAFIADGTITRSQVETVNLTRSTQQAFSHVVSFHVPYGQYKVRVKRTDNTPDDFTYPSGNKGKRSQDCYLLTITGYSNQRPVNPPKPLAMTALKIKATNQINGSVDGVSGTVQSICLDYTGKTIATATRNNNTVSAQANGHGLVVGDKINIAGMADPTFDGNFTVASVDTNTFTYQKNGTNAQSSGGRLWVKRVTRNCASIFRHVLQHPGNARRLADGKIDIAALENWHIYCKSNGFNFNTVLTAQKSLEEVLRDIAAAGRASPQWIDGKRSVVIDRPRAQYAQFFTPHNSWGFEATRALPNLPHAFRVSFNNEDKGYQPDERRVFNDGYSDSTATLYEALELPGVTKSDTVFKHARFHLAQLKLRPETYTLNADIENLVCNRGDLVRVAHDVPMWGLATGRIKERVNDTTLELSESMPMAAGTSYALRIRLADGSSVTRTVSPKSVDGDYTSIALTTTISSTQGAAGNLFMFGEIGREAVDLIVQAIEPSNNLSARLSLVDYSPDVYSSDEEEIPSFDSQITLPPILLRATISAKPTIVAIVSDERVMTRIAPGRYRYAMRVSFTNPRTLPGRVNRVEGQIDFAEDNTTDFQTIAFAPIGGSVLFQDVQEGSQYRLRLRYVDEEGRSGPWTQIQTHTVVGKLNPPAPVTGLVLTEEGDKIRIEWDANEEVDVENYEVRKNNSNWGAADSSRVFYGNSTHCLFSPPQMSSVRSFTFYVKARDGAGLFSQLSVNSTFSYSQVPPSVLTATFNNISSVSATVTLDWDDVTTPFGLRDYQISDSVHTYYYNASQATLPANWVGERVFTAKTRDRLGNLSSGKSLTVTISPPGTVPTPALEVTGAVSGKCTVMLDWEAAARGTLAIAGYEVRSSNSGWGTPGYKYQGATSSCSLNNVSTSATTNWYLKAFDTHGNYSTAAQVVAHDSVRPGNVGAVTMTRSGANLTIRASGYTKPADFSHFEFRIVKSTALYNSDPWDQADPYTTNSVSDTTTVSLTQFPTPRYSATGIHYRVACRMMDRSGNYSQVSAISGDVMAFNLVGAKMNQTINFGTAPRVAVGTTGTVTATGGSSRNPVTFSSITPSVCTVSGSIVTGVAAGTCTIVANQAGNDNYNAAPQATQNIIVDPIFSEIYIEIVSLQGGGNTIKLAELGFFDSDVRVNGDFYDSGSIHLTTLTDGNYSTVWTHTVQYFGYFVSFIMASPMTLEHIKLLKLKMQASQYTDCTPVVFNVMVDNPSWLLVKSIANINWSGNETKVFDLS